MKEKKEFENKNLIYQDLKPNIIATAQVEPTYNGVKLKHPINILIDDSKDDRIIIESKK